MYALDGIRIVDLSRVLSGPFATMILADLGAEVIKIESPEGDDSRFFGPMVEGDSAYYRLFNRGKYSVTMNLKDESDRSSLVELIKRADVVVENFRPGVLDRLGLPAATMLNLNPRLVIASITGFGQDGPWAGRAAYDLIAQAMSGVMAVTGTVQGGPTRVGISIGDLIPGLYAAIGVLGALHERDRTGRGQHIDIAMVDSLVSILESVGIRALHNQDAPVAVGNDHAMTAPFSTYATRDQPIAIAVSNDKLFAMLAQALDRPQWLTDDRFRLYDNRDIHREALRECMEEALKELTATEAEELLTRHGVPASVILTPVEVVNHPHLRQRGLIREEADGFTTLGSALRLEGSRTGWPAPALGEHNAKVAEWLREDVRSAAPDSGK